MIPVIALWVVTLIVYGGSTFVSGATPVSKEIPQISLPAAGDVCVGIADFHPDFEPGETSDDRSLSWTLTDTESISSIGFRRSSTREVSLISWHLFAGAGNFVRAP